MAAGKQIGNAVPVLLGEALISHISEWIGSLDEKADEQTALTVQEISG